MWLSIQTEAFFYVQLANVVGYTIMALVDTKINLNLNESRVTLHSVQYS